MDNLSRVHPKFCLNGHSYGLRDLGEVGYSLVKEGEPHEQEIGDFILDWVSARPHVHVTTSGSTGPPTVRVLQKEQMCESALATSRFFNLKAGDRALLCLPARYIAGKMMLVRALVLGLSLDYVAPGSEPLAGVRQTYDFSAMVPGQFINSLDRMACLKTLIIGGAPLGEFAEKAAQALDTKIYETFGMTETISHIALRKVNPPDSCFRTLPGIYVKTDKRGCLQVHAPKISHEPVQTNDVVELLSDTEFIWLGRLGNMVNSGGIKLMPEEIEQKIQQAIPHPFFLAGLPDRTLGEKLVLVLEAEQVPNGLLETLRALKSLDQYELPREIRNVPAFARTGSGKVNRHETLVALGAFGKGSNTNLDQINDE